MYWPLYEEEKFSAFWENLIEQSLPGRVYASGVDTDFPKSLPFIIAYQPELSRYAPTN